ncbi:MAG: hypothetical protein LBQ40_02975 [Clostridiales bacterium]|jgi:spore germination protein KC|nr:hypothetical protein [Clostridiales bacterium]
MRNIKGKKKVLILFLTLSVFVLLSANIKNVGLNKRALVVGLGIDREGDEYELTAQTFMAKRVSDSSPGNGQALTVGAKGKSVDKAVAALNVKTGKTLSFALCYVVIIGGETAKNGVADALDFLINKSDIASNSMMLFTKEKAKDAMDINSPINQSGMMLLHDMLSDKQSKSYSVKTIKDFNADYYSRSRASFVPVLDKIDGEKSGGIAQDGGGESGSGEKSGGEQKNQYYGITETAVFKDGAYAFLLDRDETLYLNFLERNNTRGVFTAEFDDGKNVTFETDRKRLKTKYDLNGPSFTAEIKVLLTVCEITRDDGRPAAQNQTQRVALTDNERRTVADKIKNGVYKTLQKCKENKTDVLFLNDNFYQRFGKKWTAQAGENYLDMIDIKINVTVNAV